MTALDPHPSPSCPICGLNEAVTKERLGQGWRWYCTGPCGATVFTGGDDEWRHHAKDRDRITRRRQEVTDGA